MVTLFGEVIRSEGSHTIFSVAANLGDARSVGIHGHVHIPTKHIFLLEEQFRGDAAGFWKIRISFELASLIALRCQPRN